MKKVEVLADINGEVTKDEFVKYAKNSEFFNEQMDNSNSQSMAARAAAIAKAEHAFKAFDKNNDGYITKEEFAKISKKIWLKNTIDEWSELVTDLDLLETTCVRTSN